MNDSERRTSRRQRTLKAGKIVLSHGTSVLDCTVRNVTSTGASLSLPSAATVPAEFDLQLDGETRPCTVVWRRLAGLGVKFR
jgi:PilZ domain